MVTPGRTTTVRTTHSSGGSSSTAAGSRRRLRPVIKNGLTEFGVLDYRNPVLYNEDFFIVGKCVLYAVTQPKGKSVTQFTAFNIRAEITSPRWHKIDIAWLEIYTVQRRIYHVLTFLIIIYCALWVKRSTVLFLHDTHERLHLVERDYIGSVYTVHSTIS